MRERVPVTQKTRKVEICFNWSLFTMTTKISFTAVFVCRLNGVDVAWADYINIGMGDSHIPVAAGGF